jgi:ABC-type transport system involved in multi-copper enzyme maturation permease subunit
VTGSLRRLWAVARNTFVEAVRNRVLHVSLVFAVLVLAGAPLLGELTVGEERRTVVDMGLWGISFFGVAIGIVLGVSLVYQELERRTIYVILSKPVRRWEFVVGKYAGMALTLLALVALMVPVFLATLWLVGAAPGVEVVKALVLVTAEILLMCAVALLFSSFSTPVLSGVLAFGIFVLGRLTEEILALADKTTLAGSEWALGLLAHVLPNLQLFSVSGRSLDGAWVSVHGTFVTWGYVGTVLLYGATYAALALGLAAFLFNRREFS